MKLALVFLLTLALAGCASQGFKTPLQQTEAACVTASGAYKVITAANNIKPLSASQQADVLAAIKKTNAYCKPVKVPDGPLDQLAFDQAIDLLNAYLVRIQK
jgi:hypothetical protein